ncbi:MAG: DUF2807 domain-containing protein [bacterium]|nr:DUF2807 domain-containing protein [bacterium]
MRFRHAAPVLCALLLIAVVTMPAEARWGRTIEGSGDMETRELDLDTFDAIDLGGAFEVTITFGDYQKIEVTIDDNLWDNLEADVKGGVLEIGWDKSCNPDDDCEIVIVMKELERFDVHGACSALIEDFDGDRFEFTVSGAADLDIDGEVDELEIQISGAGDLDARSLKAKHVKVRISGAGNGELYASESIDARISGAGSLDYWGSPEKEKTKVSGVGSIDSH